MKARRLSLPSKISLLLIACLASLLAAEESVRTIGYESLTNTAGGNLVAGVLFDLEVTADEPITIDQFEIQIRGNNASTWDFSVVYREGSLIDEVDGMPVHRIEEEWTQVGSVDSVDSPPSNQGLAILLDEGPAEEGGLTLEPGRYSFYFISRLVEGVSGNGLRTVNPATPPDDTPPFYQLFDVILESPDLKVLSGGGKGSAFGSTNPASNLRMPGTLSLSYRGGVGPDGPAPLPDPEELLVSSGDFTYTQDFNSLGGESQTWVDSGTLPGWHLFALEDASFGMDGRTLPATGGIMRRTYKNFGFSDDERALGATAGSVFSGIPEIENVPVNDVFGFMALALKNETGSVIDALNLSYDGLQFELGNSSAPQELRVGSTRNDGSAPSDPTAWTEQPEANFFTPRLSTAEAPQPTGLINPFLPENRANRLTSTLEGLDWQPGETLWIRWMDTNAPGGDHGVLIDNVSVSLGSRLHWDGGSWVAADEAAGGAGLWENGAGDWNPAGIAVFGGAGGEVSLGTVEAAGGLRFESDGYVLSGGNLVLGGPVEAANSIFVAEGALTEILGPLSAPEGFVKTGPGTLFLGGELSAGGRSAIHAGTLSASAAMLDTDLDVRGTLLLDDAEDSTLAGFVSGNGRIEKSGTGTLTLEAARAFTGDFVALEGSLRGSSSGLPGGTIAVGDELIVDQSEDGTLGGLVSGNGRLVKTGPGTLTLTSGNIYEGGTAVEEGILLIDGDQSAVFDSATTVAAGAALGGGGAIGGEVQAAVGSAIVPGGRGTIGEFVMFDGGSLAGSLEMEVGATQSDRLTVFEGSLDISAATLDLNLMTGDLELPVYLLISYGDAASVSGEFAAVNGLPAGYELDYGYPGGYVALVDSASGGAGYGMWLAGFDPIDEALAGPFADADGGGVANVLEFVLNGDPTDPADNGLQAVWTDEEATENSVRLTIAAPRGTSFSATAEGPQTALVDGFEIRVEGSATLEGFELEVEHLGAADEAEAAGLPSLVDSDWEYHTFRLTGGGDTGFLRVTAD